MEESELLKKAFEARKNSYCPYSGFAVGAALLAKNGVVYTGCNVENASYGVSNCAERTALYKAVSEGVYEFSAIAIVGGKRQMQEGETEYCSPCGICRQALVEFCKPDFKIILGKSQKQYKVYTMEELLPVKFLNDAQVACIDKK